MKNSGLQVNQELSNVIRNTHSVDIFFLPLALLTRVSRQEYVQKKQGVVILVFVGLDCHTSDMYNSCLGLMSISKKLPRKENMRSIIGSSQSLGRGVGVDWEDMIPSIVRGTFSNLQFQVSAHTNELNTIDVCTQ